MVFFFLLCFYIFYYSSLHSLIILLFVECFVLLNVFIFFDSLFSWFSGVMFLLVSVCVGAYGVSLFVSLLRSKGVSYYMVF